MKDGVVCYKRVCERGCVKDGVSKMVCERWCVTKPGVSKMVCDKVVCDHMVLTKRSRETRVDVTKMPRLPREQVRV